MSRFHKVYVVTITKNTTDLTNVIKSTEVLSGILTLLHIDIPEGWNYNAGIQIKIGRHVFPEEGLDANQTFTGNDTELPLRPRVELNEEKLSVDGFNNDVLNDHTCVITIEVEQEEKEFKNA